MMTNSASKLKRALCSTVAMLAILAGISAVSVFAATPGIYTATATSHYRHPTTGVIEDSGGESSYVLGQSMTDSALNKAALVEVDSGGATWVTIRLNLMDNIQSPRFQVDGSSVSATLMQEDYSNNTADYRMRVGSENSIIRCNMYVIPMGREVIFYITVGGLSAGSGDFVTSITVEEPEPVVEPEPEPEQPAATTPQTPSNQTPSTQTPSFTAEPSAQPTEETPPSTEEAVTEEPVTEDPDSETSSDDEEEEESSALGLAEFDESGNAVSKPSTEAEQDSTTGNPVIWWVIGGIIVVAIAGGCVWYFCFFRKGKNPFLKK